MGMLITILLLCCSFKLLGLLFSVCGKLLGCVFGLLGYAFIGVLAVTVFGLALTMLPVVIGAGVVGILMLCTKAA